MIACESLRGFWNSVPAEFRHIPGALDTEKALAHLKRFLNYARVPWGDVRAVLDWGCGGGIIAQNLVDRGLDVTLADISSRSLATAVKFCGCEKTIHVPDDLADMPPVDSPDVIVCYAVLHHFPSLDYFHAVAAYWRSLSPRYIAIQACLGKRVKEAASYFVGKNYMRGLILTQATVRRAFPEYRCIVDQEDGCEWGHFTMRRA